MKWPLSYFGRKQTLFPWLEKYFPPHRSYCEPFCGSGAVLAQKRRTQVEFISDIDPNLINFLVQLRDKWRLLKAVCHHDYDKEFFKYAHYNFHRIQDPVEAARYYFAANRQAFKSLPAVRHPTWDDRKASMWKSSLSVFSEAAERLTGVEIRCIDYRTALLLNDSEDTFHYCDPPYLYCSRAKNPRNYWFDMGESDEHIPLLNLVQTLKGKVMLSGYPSTLYDRELAGWRKRQTVVQSPYTGAGETRTEKIWMNY